MKQKIIKLLENHTPYDRKEKDDLKKTIEFAKNEVDCFQKTNLKGHITTSAWIINSKKSHCLLMHHKTLNLWLNLGGHLEDDLTIQEAASREAYEESGLKNLELYRNTIFDLDVHLIPATQSDPQHHHYDIRFLFLSHEMVFKKNEESIALRWTPLNEVKILTNDTSILRMVNKSSTL